MDTFEFELGQAVRNTRDGTPGVVHSRAQVRDDVDHYQVLCGTKADWVPVIYLEAATVRRPRPSRPRLPG